MESRVNVRTYAVRLIGLAGRPRSPGPRYPSILLDPLQMKSGSKSAQKARKRFCTNDLLKSGDTLRVYERRSETNEPA